jgi:hypothetical protein
MVVYICLALSTFQVISYLGCVLLSASINPLNAELNPICHLLAFLGAHHFLHVSRIRVKFGWPNSIFKCKNECYVM